MATRTLTPNRSVSRPLRINPITIVSVLIIAVALGGLVRYAGSLSATRPLLMATRDLPVGATLGPDDLVPTEGRLDDPVYEAAVPGTALGELVGRQLAEPVHRNQILVRAQITTGARLGPDQMALTIPVKAEAAAGGTLRAGDQVQVLVTRDKGKPNSETSVVLERVTIYTVGHIERASIVNTSGGRSGDEAAPLASLTLVVTADQARALANARHGGELDVALLSPLPATPAARSGQ